jgi:Uncharacterised nucleotidyltransferase
MHKIEQQVRPKSTDLPSESAATDFDVKLQLLCRSWPPERQILLMTAALGRPDAAAGAWRKWNELCSLDEATSEEVRLLATIARRMSELDPRSPLMPRLQGARRYIFTRTQLTLAAARPLLAALSESGVRLMLIKGAVRIAAEPSLAAERTLRDVDILVHPDDLATALAIVERLGWKPRLTNPWMVDGGLAERFPVFHAIGLNPPEDATKAAVDLHQFAVPMCRNVGDDAAIWSRARKTTLLGIPFFAPSSTDSVLITLAHVTLVSGEKTADWALDIEPAIREGKIQWEVFLTEAHARRIQAFLAAPLMLAVNRLEMPVPTGVIAELAAALDKTSLKEFGFLAMSTFDRRTRYASIEAIRDAAVIRSQRAAHREGKLNGDRRRRRHLPPIIVPSSLAPRELARVALEHLHDPEEELFLEARFSILSASGFPSVMLRAPGIDLKFWPPPTWRKTQFLECQNVVLSVPAALFMMRRITQVGIWAGPTTAITALRLRWLPTTTGKNLWNKIRNLPARLIEALSG